MSNEHGGSARAGNGTGGVKRIGNAERESAVALLEDHWRAGRLDPGEHELRVTRARSAVTEADLGDLFVDLPQVGTEPTDVIRGDRRPRGGVRETIMALMPFVALVLFFTRGGWLWFLLVPVAGIVLYGADGNPNGRHGWFWGRHRNRGR